MHYKSYAAVEYGECCKVEYRILLNKESDVLIKFCQITKINLIMEMIIFLKSIDFEGGFDDFRKNLL